MKRSICAKGEGDKSPLKVEENFLWQKRLRLAVHPRDGDVGQVDRQLVAVEGEARLGCKGPQLHQGGSSKPGQGWPACFSTFPTFACVWMCLGTAQVRVRCRKKLVQSLAEDGVPQSPGKEETLKLRLPTSSTVSSESASWRPSSNCVVAIHLPRCSFKNISGSQGPPLSRPRFSHRTLPSPRLPPRLGRPRPRPPARPPPSRPQSSKRCHQGWSSCMPAIWTQRLARKQPG